MLRKFHGAHTVGETLTRRQRMFAFFHRKREWVKLNAAYAIATGTNLAVTEVTAHLARRRGISDDITSWLPVVNGFFTGVWALVVSWYFLHVERYHKDLDKIAKDTEKMLKNVVKAQLVSWAVIIPAGWLLLREGIVAEVVVAAQYIIDKVVYIPAFNFFSRHLIRETSQEAQEKPE